MLIPFSHDVRHVCHLLQHLSTMENANKSVILGMAKMSHSLTTEPSASLQRLCNNLHTLLNNASVSLMDIPITIDNIHNKSLFDAYRLAAIRERAILLWPHVLPTGSPIPLVLQVNAVPESNEVALELLLEMWNECVETAEEMKDASMEWRKSPVVEITAEGLENEMDDWYNRCQQYIPVDIHFDLWDNLGPANEEQVRTFVAERWISESIGETLTAQ